MRNNSPINTSRFLEHLALIFMWLVVIGSGLLGIGMAILHEVEHHG